MPKIVRFSLAAGGPDGSAVGDSYEALLKAYLDKRLHDGVLREARASDAGGVPFSREALFDLIIDKADRRFAFVSFIAERIVAGHLSLKDIGALENGDGIYRDWLADLDRTYGSKRADRLREILALLLAAEAAQARAFGPAMIPDPVDGTALTSFGSEQFEGLPVIVIAELMNLHDREALTPAERFDPRLIFDLQELQGALRISRSGDGSNKYRLALKEFAVAAEADPQLAPQIVIAERTIAETAEQAAETLAKEHANLVSRTNNMSAERQDAETAWHNLPDWLLFETLAPLWRGLSICRSGSQMSGRCISLIWPRASRTQQSGQMVRAIRMWNDALALALPRVSAEDPDGKSRYRVAGLLGGRGVAKQQSAGHGVDAAIRDHDAEIRIMEELRADLGEAWRQNPALRNALATTYTNRGSAKRRSAALGADAAIEDYDAAIEIMEALRTDLGEAWCQDPDLRSTLAMAYMNRGVAKEQTPAHGADAAIEDYGAAIRIMEALCTDLGEAWRQYPDMRNDLAGAYMNRGIARQQSAAHGADAAIEDYDTAIEIKEALRADLGEAWRQAPALRNDLATAYANRGVAKEQSAVHGANAAIKDYDAAIRTREALRADLGEAWRQNPALRDDLAGAYMNRGVAKWQSAAHGDGAAIADHDAAIEIREALRVELGEAWRRNPELRNNLAKAYVNRGNAKQQSAAHGADAAFEDHDAAIRIMEELRADLGEAWRQNPPLRNDLAYAYLNRGTAKRQSAAHGADAAIEDCDAAIEIMEALRADLGEAWRKNPALRNRLAKAYLNRGIAKAQSVAHGVDAAIEDYEVAVSLWDALIADAPTFAPVVKNYRDGVAQEIQGLRGAS
ncbi:MAG: hypothetical protein KKB37_00445 [Alphaproteobacteria bacterium]|nr:hypothetical protein [Alphaproteobacteria bacterium]